MQIIFDDSSAVPFVMLDTPLASVYQKVFSHLQHIDIPFREWDDPYHSIDSAASLSEAGSKLGIAVDQTRCNSLNQPYLNELHSIYEQQYDGDPNWLDYHEQIHLCETPREHFLNIDFREKAGLLERPFDLTWLNHSSTTVQAGDVFVQWSELGKIPYTYWNNGEPNDMSRIKELAKPWLKLRPKLCFALEDYDFLANKKAQEFQSWWTTYHADWCQHWNIPKWDLRDMYSVLVVGNIAPSDLNRLSELLISGKQPKRVRI